MKVYKVYMDLSCVLQRLKRFDLGVYNSSHPILFVEADDPDGACFKALGGLFFKLKQQSVQGNHTEILMLCKSITHDIRITKVYVPS